MDLHGGKKAHNPLSGEVCLLTTGGLLCGRTCQALFMIFPLHALRVPVAGSTEAYPPTCAGGFMIRGALWPQTTFYPW